jgi:hypothetical protein
MTVFSPPIQKIMALGIDAGGSYVDVHIEIVIFIKKLVDSI